MQKSAGNILWLRGLLACVVIATAPHHAIASPQHQSKMPARPPVGIPRFVQRIFTDKPSVYPTTRETQSLAKVLQEGLSRPIKLKELQKRAAVSKRGRLVTTSTQFSVGAASGSVAQGAVKVREGRLHVSFFRATDSSVVAIVESVTVAPSQRGSIGKQVQEMQRAGFRVDKVPLMFQVAYFRAAKGGSIGESIQRPPIFVSPLLSGKEALTALGLSMPKATASVSAGPRAAPSAVVAMAGVSADTSAPFVDAPQDSNGRPKAEPEEPKPGTEFGPPGDDSTFDCVVDVLDGVLQRCCAQPPGRFRNCTAFTEDFRKGCEEKDLVCKSLDWQCDDAAEGHRMGLTMLSDGTWVAVEPQSRTVGEPTKPRGIIGGIRLSEPVVDDKTACKLAGRTEEECNCGPDEDAAGSGASCDCHATVRDENLKPNSDPDACLTAVREGRSVEDGKPLDLSGQTPQEKHATCIECCESYYESNVTGFDGIWLKACKTACEAINPDITPAPTGVAVP